jgi:(E)-4-hydroxy-3-methylbut-2-enyl-diphosphate synthase
VRKITKKLMLKNVPVGDNSPVTVQSMCTTKTHEVQQTLEQIEQLHEAGCEIIRVAVPGDQDATALRELAEKSPIPVVADVHFQPLYVFRAFDAGVAGVRVNPGNIRKFNDKLQGIVNAAKLNGIPLRIGVNAGSLDDEILKKHGESATSDALVEAAMREVRLFEDCNFHDFAISVKHHDVNTTVDAYSKLSELVDYPLHLGITEAGPKFQGTVKSAVAFGALLRAGIGDTIRVSLTDNPIEEVRVGREILMSLGLKTRALEIISCPTCGRIETDVIELTARLETALQNYGQLGEKPLKIAVMGCIVNGPGEARDADIGVAGGKGKGDIFVRGKVIKTVPEAAIIPQLLRLVEEFQLAEKF